MLPPKNRSISSLHSPPQGYADEAAVRPSQPGFFLGSVTFFKIGGPSLKVRGGGKDVGWTGRTPPPNLGKGGDLLHFESDRQKNKTKKPDPNTPGRTTARLSHTGRAPVSTNHSCLIPVDSLIHSVWSDDFSNPSTLCFPRPRDLSLSLSLSPSLRFRWVNFISFYLIWFYFNYFIYFVLFYLFYLIYLFILFYLLIFIRVFALSAKGSMGNHPAAFFLAFFFRAPEAEPPSPRTSLFW